VTPLAGCEPTSDITRRLLLVGHSINGAEKRFGHSVRRQLSEVHVHKRVREA
jgi:hypothetical protein